MTQNADDFMDGSAVASASFNGPPPITWAGFIPDDAQLVQKRDFDDGTPLEWPDGRPKMLLQVNVMTDHRDANIPEDDGKRALYLEFRKKDAVQEAIKRAGQKGAPKKGGWLSLTYTADDLAAKKGKGNPPKLYQAEYRPPDPWQGEDQQAGWPQGAAQAPPQGPPQGAWAQMPPPQPQAAYSPPPAAQPYQAPPPQQPYQAPPNPQQYTPQPTLTGAPNQGVAAPAPGPAPAGDPLADFLLQRNIDVNVMPREQAEMIARNLGYTG